MAPGVLDYLEQPVADDDLPGMAMVAAALPCPVCFDEGLHGPRDIEAHAAARAAQGVGLKAIKLGGLQATLAADALARRLGMRTTWACKIAESSIGAASVLHAAAVLPEVEWGVSVTHRYLAEDVVAEPVAVLAGDATLPAGPGLGLAPCMAPAISGRSRPSAKAMARSRVGWPTASTARGMPSSTRGDAIAATTRISQPNCPSAAARFGESGAKGGAS
jgi:hypothetical protein